MTPPTTSDCNHDAPASFAAPTWLGGFVVNEETYPSGKKYLLVKRGKERIGNCEQVADGFLVWGKRKPVATLLLAVKQMLDDGMNRARAEQARWQKLMCCLKTECGPIPPNEKGLATQPAPTTPEKHK